MSLACVASTSITSITGGAIHDDAFFRRRVDGDGGSRPAPGDGGVVGGVISTGSSSMIVCGTLGGGRPGTLRWFMLGLSWVLRVYGIGPS